MKSSKLIGYLVVLFSIGAIGFAALAVLVEYRIGQPLRPLAAAQAPQSTASQDSLALLTTGTQFALETARSNFEQGRRSEAVTALDAAMRTAEVGEYVAQGDRQSRFTRTLDAIKRTRRALQNGNPSEAQRMLEEAATMLSPANAPAASTSAPMPAQDTWGAYNGATLINAAGVRLGEVDRIQPSGNGAATAVVRLGNQDVLGFPDLGGTQLTVPGDGLLFGNHQTLGSTFVVLPTFETTTEQIQAWAGSA